MDTYTQDELKKFKVAELKTIADSYEIDYNTKTKKDDLIADILTQQELKSWTEIGTGSDNLGNQGTFYVAPVGTPMPKPYPHNRRVGERGLVNGKPMPIHYNGRAMGAKHYAELRGK